MSSVAEVVNYDNNNGTYYFTVDAGANIPKGSFVVLIADPRTVTAQTSNDNVFIGIAAADKDPTDGSTLLAIHTRGIFDCVADGAITLGAFVRHGPTAANDVSMLTATNVSSDPICLGTLADIIGVSLETASDNEVVQIMIGAMR